MPPAPAQARSPTRSASPASGPTPSRGSSSSGPAPTTLDGHLPPRDSWGITPTDGQSLDLYAYTQNDPIDRVDPSGHCWGICFDIRPPSLPIPDLSAAAHSALGVVSIVPGPIGSAAAVADAGLYAYEGDYESAAISLVAVVPFGGPILSKGEQALKFVNKVREADRVATAGADIEKAAKAIDKAESTVNDLKSRRSPEARPRP